MANDNYYDDATVAGWSLDGTGWNVMSAVIVASKAVTDNITVTQAVNLDTMETDVAASKTVTDNITVTQAVNLDTMESDIASALSVTDNITVTQAVNLDTMEIDVAASKTVTDNITITQAVNLDTMESDIALNNTHRTSNGADHTYIDQSVVSGAAPTFAATNFTSLPIEFGISASDETTALEVGTAKATFRMPCAMTVTAVRASVTTAPTGAALTIDINEGGVSILSTLLTIDATEKTSTTAATPAVISDSALADDAEITIDIDVIGSTIAGAGLKVWLIGTRA